MDKIAKIRLCKNRVGLTLGIFAALLHAIWASTVWLGVGRNVIDWIMPLHFLNVFYSISVFNLTTALTLVICAFVGGYIMGWIFAAIWNLFKK